MPRLTYVQLRQDGPWHFPEAGHLPAIGEPVTTRCGLTGHTHAVSVDEWTQPNASKDITSGTVNVTDGPRCSDRCPRCWS